MTVVYRLENLTKVYPMLLPFSLSMTIFAVASQPVSEGPQRRTLERLLALPLAWREIVIGKVVAYAAMGVAFGILLWGAYWVLTGLVAPGVPTAGRLAQSGLLIAASAWYIPTAALVASAYVRVSAHRDHPFRSIVIARFGPS
jgi:ABC-type Na+ efflux pump permease subunit